MKNQAEQTDDLLANPWRTLDSKEIYRNPWIRLREDQVINPDGSRGIYGVVETRIATGVVAITPKNEIYMIGQYRYPVEEYSWEIPEGGTEKDEPPLDAAKRELREEAGIIATDWQQLGGEFHVSNCISAERGFLYIAHDLQEVEMEPEGTEILQVRKMPFEECLKMLDTGEIKDSITIIGLLRAARLLGIK